MPLMSLLTHTDREFSLRSRTPLARTYGAPRTLRPGVPGQSTSSLSRCYAAARGCSCGVMPSSAAAALRSHPGSGASSSGHPPDWRTRSRLSSPTPRVPEWEVEEGRYGSFRGRRQPQQIPAEPHPIPEQLKDDTEEAPDVVQQGRELVHAAQDVSGPVPTQRPSEAPDSVFRGDRRRCIIPDYRKEQLVDMGNPR